MITVSAQVVPERANLSQAIEHRAFGGAKGFATFFADKAPLLLRMNANVTPADLASGIAIGIGTEYS
jgi:hypothetical protein